MRIISKFSDYYDVIQSFDKDDILFERKSERKLLSECLKRTAFLSRVCRVGPNDSTRFREIRFLGYNERIIGFCGKIYQIGRAHV